MKLKAYATPIILSVIILGLAGIAYWDENKTAKDKTAEEAKGKLFDFDPAQIQTVSVTNVTAEPKSWIMTQDMEQKAWSISSPIQYAADGEGIIRLLKIIVDAKSEREFDLGQKSLATYGLEPAQIVYEMKDAKGKTWKLEIGGKAPTGYSSYARVEGDPKLHLVNQYLFTATNKTLSDFRNKGIGVPNSADIQKISVTFAGDKPVRLERKEKEWFVVEPFQGKGDTLDINKWISGWDSLRAADFIDSPGPDLRKALTVTGKGTKELARVTFETTNGQKEFIVVENNGKVYTQLSDQTFVELDRPSVESLRKAPKEFEDRSVFKFVSTDVTDVSIDGVAYKREGESWVQVSDKKPMPFIQGMLVSLEFTKADSKLSTDEGEKAAKGPALHTVEIREGEKPKVQFSIWKNPASEDGMLVLKNGDSYYQVNNEFLDVLKPKSGATEPTLGGEVKGEKS